MFPQEFYPYHHEIFPPATSFMWCKCFCGWSLPQISKANASGRITSFAFSFIFIQELFSLLLGCLRPLSEHAANSLYNRENQFSWEQFRLSLLSPLNLISQIQYLMHGFNYLHLCACTESLHKKPPLPSPRTTSCWLSKASMNNSFDDFMVSLSHSLLPTDMKFGIIQCFARNRTCFIIKFNYTSSARNKRKYQTYTFAVRWMRRWKRRDNGQLENAF